MDDAQLAAMMKSWQDQLAKQMEAMRVRQWCVEQALKAMDSGADVPALMRQGPDEMMHVEFAAVALANEILKFITTPFAEVFTDKT